MKKRSKFTLRTKIYLTTVGLLALTGVIYGSASFFSPDLGPLNQGPVGVAASRTELFASDFCIGLLNPNHRNIANVNCDGTFSMLTSIPSFVGDTCEEITWLSLHPSLRMPGSRRVTFLSQMAFLSIGSRHPIHPIPSPRLIYLRRSQTQAAIRTIPGLRSTMWAHLVTT